MRNQGNKPKILIFGSCVTRDIFNHEPSKELEFVDIFARTSPVSLMAPAIKNMPDLSANQSSFQQRMVTWDMTKRFWSFIKETKFDALVFDFIDERFRHVEYGNSWLTKSNEAIVAKVIDKNADSFGWPEEKYKNLFIAGLKKIKQELIKDQPTAKVILNKIHWSTHFDTGEKITAYTEFFTKKNNEHLDWVHDQFCKEFNNACVIEYDHDLIKAKKNHQWGEAPFHYQDSFYIHTIAQLIKILTETNAANPPSRDESTTYSDILPDTGKTKISISVDVEALPSRTQNENKIDRLIWGNFPSGQFGLKEIVNSFKKYNIPATFYLEYLGAERYGKQYILEIGEFIEKNGFDLQMHAHPELLGNTKLSHLKANSLAELTLSQQQEIIIYTKSLRDESTKSKGDTFRSGGLKFNQQTIEAASNAGILYLSNYYTSPYEVAGAYKAVPPQFNWLDSDNNVIATELTVSACIDPVIQSGADWQSKLDLLLQSTTGYRHFFLHSWSLIPRDGSGFHDNAEVNYLSRFHEILEYLSKNFYFVENKISIAPLPNYPINSLTTSSNDRPQLDLDATGQKQNRPKMHSNWNARTVAKYEFTIYSPEDLSQASDLPVTAKPLRLNPTQSLVILKIDLHGHEDILPFVISGHRGIIQLRRARIPFGHLTTEIFWTIFSRFPQITEISFTQLYGDGLLTSPYIQTKAAGSTYLLKLPNTFNEYRTSTINSDFAKLIERKSRAIARDYPATSLRQFGERGGELLDRESFRRLLDVVRTRMQSKATAGQKVWADPYTDEWIENNFPIYEKHGFCVGVYLDENPIAVMLNLSQGSALHYMAGGFTDHLGGNYHLSKIIYLEFIKRAISYGYTNINLGGGDFGFKEKLGAMEYHLHSGTAKKMQFEYDNTVHKETNTLHPRTLSAREYRIYSNKSLRSILDPTQNIYYLELPDSGLGQIPTGWRTIQQPNIDALDAIFNRMDALSPVHGFYDWNAGNCKTLIAAHDFWQCEVGGLFANPEINEIGVANLKKCGINIKCQTTHLDLSTDGRINLSGFDVFFAYNPCAEPTMKKIIEAMLDHAGTTRKKIWFLYVNSVHDKLCLNSGFEKVSELSKENGGWRFSDRGTIYSLTPR